MDGTYREVLRDFSSAILCNRRKYSEAVMSFKIDDLVIHITQAGCPPRSCFNTTITGFLNFEDALGKEDLSMEMIKRKLSAQIIENPTKGDLVMLEAELVRALEAVRSKMT
jgi:hypothetical protein